MAESPAELPVEAPLLVALDRRGVLRLTMNRPDVHNAFDDHQAQRLIQALDRAAGDDAVRAIGEKAARRFFTTAETLSAEKALALNLLSEVVAEDALDATVEGIVAALLGNGPAAICKAKRIVFDVAGGAVTDGMIEHTVRFIADTRGSDEGREGLNAFLEKRTPAWAQSGN